METTQLKDLKLSSEMLDANQISSTFVHKDGTIDDGNISLNGNANINGQCYVSNNLRVSHDTNENATCYLDSKSFLHADMAKTSYGKACTGSMGYCILGVDDVNKAYKLSGDVSKLSTYIASKPNAYFSISLFSGFVSHQFQILSVKQSETSAGLAYMKTDMTNPLYNGVWNLVKNNQESAFVKEFVDPTGDNGLYCLEDSDIGNQPIINGFYNMASGGSVKAIGKYSQAFGRKVWADGRYSHGEGQINIAGGVASHVEGAQNAAYGNYSHAAGSYSDANSDMTYVWNGTDDSANRYSVNRSGTFNINPKGGSEGFYIGEENLYKIINDIVKKVTSPVTYITDKFEGNMADTIDHELAYNEYATISSKGDVLSDDFFDNIDYSKLETIYCVGKNFTKTKNEPNYDASHYWFLDHCYNVTNFTSRSLLSVGTSFFKPSPGTAKCKLTSINLPAVTYIGVHAFNSCKSIRKLNVPKLEKIDTSGLAYTFASDVSSFAFDELSYLGAYGLYGNSKVKCYSFKKLNNIGHTSFGNNTNLLCIDFGTEITAQPELPYPNYNTVFSGIKDQVSCYIPNNDELYNSWQNDIKWKYWLSSDTEHPAKLVLVKHED